MVHPPPEQSCGASPNHLRAGQRFTQKGIGSQPSRYTAPRPPPTAAKESQSRGVIRAMRFAREMRFALATGLLLLAAGVRAQVTVGDELHMNLDGSLAVGYFASNGNVRSEEHTS